MAIIRPMVEADVPEIISVWKDFGFFIGTYTIDNFLKIDPRGFYVAAENGVVVGFCAAIIQNEDLAAVGLYGVKRSHQGKGIGLETWKRAMEHAGCRNCFLNAVDEQFETYRDKAGFTFIDKHRTVIWLKNCLPTYQLVERISGVKTDLVNKDILEQVIAYDEGIVGYSRSEIITKTIQEKGCISLAAVKDGIVCGYGAIRDEILGTKLLGPLYADSIDVAELILHRLLDLNPSVKECGLTFMGNDANPLSAQLPEKLGLEKRFTYARMSTKALLDAKFEKVYSMFNVDLCTV